MDSISLERLLILALFLLLPLVQLVRRWLGQAAERARPAVPPPARAEPPSRVRAARPRRPAVLPRPAIESAPAGAAAPRHRRRPRYVRPRTPRDARQAIVALTVLGPCRALEPGPPPGGAPGARG